MVRTVCIPTRERGNENRTTCSRFTHRLSTDERFNRLHREFSNDYFETGKIDKINLSRTIKHVPALPIYTYRLTLHESVNDYLMTAAIDIKYFYRVKTRESIDDKIERFSSREDQYPVNNWLNDIFGVRIILIADEIKSVMDLLG